MGIKDSGKMVAMGEKFFNLFNSQHENRETRSQNQKPTGFCILQNYVTRYPQKSQYTSRWGQTTKSHKTCMISASRQEKEKGGIRANDRSRIREPKRILQVVTEN